MTSRIKLEHYVPQFYLKRFSVEEKGKKIFCFDKDTSKTFTSSVRNIGCEKYFYDDSSGDQSVEKELAQIEPTLGKTYTKLIKVRDLNRLSWDERISIANFVVIQELRTKETREFLQDLCMKVGKELSKHKLSEDLEKQLEEINSLEHPREFHVGMLKHTKDFVDMMLTLKWILIENKTDMLFWTSDHPVNRFNPVDTFPFGNLGILSRGMQIFFPLTPTLALCLCDLVEYFPYPEKIRTNNLDNIIFQNHLQMMWATRLIFSQNGDFSLAERILKEDPSSLDKEKGRVSIL